MFSALAIADCSAFFTVPAMRFRLKVSVCSAADAFWPRISSVTRFSFCGDTRMTRSTALAAIVP